MSAFIACYHCTLSCSCMLRPNFTRRRGRRRRRGNIRVQACSLFAHDHILTVVKDCYHDTLQTVCGDFTKLTHVDAVVDRDVGS